MKLVETQIAVPSPVRPESAEEETPSTAKSSGHRAPETSPYVAARREWDERYGNFIARARNWRAAAFLALLIATLETGGLIALSMKARTVPFVVAVDSLGRVL